MPRLSPNCTPTALLQLIADEGGQTRAEIVAALGHRLHDDNGKPRLCWMLHNLRRQGLVREVVVLTDAGRTALADVEERIAERRSIEADKRKRTRTACATI